MRVETSRVLAFRLSRHHLGRRLPAGSLVSAAGAAGIQETANGNAGIALHARVEQMSPVLLDEALHTGKTLVMVWAMRGAPYIVPSEDLAIFTTGSLPVGEASLTTYCGGWAKSLGAAGRTLTDLVAQAADVASLVLDGRSLPVDEMRHEIAERLPAIRGLTRPSGAHADLPEPLFRILGQLGVVCLTERRRMTDAVVARTDQWLGMSPAPIERDVARAGLLRRFLRCYGPAAPRAFADWTTRSLADARDIFSTLAPELAEVTVDGSKGWLLAADVEELTSSPEPVGVRLLAAYDPFLQQRDRTRLVPDPSQRRQLWRPVGGPGLVLVDGKASGIWRASRNAETMAVTVERFAPLSRSVRRAIVAEAEAIAPFRGAARAAVAFS